MKLRRWILATLATLAIAALVATALAYQHPAVMIQLSEQIWACFG